MALGDKRGSGKLSDGAVVAANRAVEVERDLADFSSNIVVGEFLSELQSAIRFRMKLGQMEGDWVEEPERMFTDGAVFASEVAVASQVKLQITVSLDASTSMWRNGIMQYAGPTFAALDSIIRKSMMELPEGTVKYAPFIFHENSFRIPQGWIPHYTARVDWGKNKDGSKSKRGDAHNVIAGWPTRDEFVKAKWTGEIPLDASYGEFKVAPFKVKKEKYNPLTGQMEKIGEYTQMKQQFVSDWKLHGLETYIAPLLQAIKGWEDAEGDADATRLDIIITDGVFEDVADIERATQIQEDRNGRLRTVLLNFLPISQWENVKLPGRCGQFAVQPRNLDTSIRSVLAEAIADMFQ